MASGKAVYVPALGLALPGVAFVALKSCGAIG